jgi:CRP-like cAMP-binding protein
MKRSPARKRPANRARAAPAAATQNRLLSALPPAESSRLIARCTPVTLTFGDVLYSQDEHVEHVYFPTGSFISLLSALDGRPRLEVGLIGAEGMLGVSLLLGVTQAPLQALVQGGGSALRLDAAEFSRALTDSSVLEAQLKRYLYVLMCQLAQMAACTRFHLVEARLARWLLMTRDRAGSSEFYLTQEFLAYMLGVRRAGITGAARALQKRKLIQYKRGVVTVLDGPRLAAAACECYRASARMYAAVMRTTSKPVVATA